MSIQSTEDNDFISGAYNPEDLLLLRCIRISLLTSKQKLIRHFSGHRHLMPLLTRLHERGYVMLDSEPWTLTTRGALVLGLFEQLQAVRHTEQLTPVLADSVRVLRETLSSRDNEHDSLEYWIMVNNLARVLYKLGMMYDGRERLKSLTESVYVARDLHSSAIGAPSGRFDIDKCRADLHDGFATFLSVTLEHSVTEESDEAIHSISLPRLEADVAFACSIVKDLIASTGRNPAESMGLLWAAGQYDRTSLAVYLSLHNHVELLRQFVQTRAKDRKAFRTAVEEYTLHYLTSTFGLYILRHEEYFERIVTQVIRLIDGMDDDGGYGEGSSGSISVDWIGGQPDSGGSDDITWTLSDE